MEASRAALPATGVRQIAGDYFELTKPKVQLLLLLTTITTMYVAGDPSIGLVAVAVVGGFLSAGGAGAFNHWYDRDIDQAMARTANRPIPAGRISSRSALVYAFSLQIASFVILPVGANVGDSSSAPSVNTCTWRVAKSCVATLKRDPLRCMNVKALPSGLWRGETL